MIARNINLVIPLAASPLLVLWGRWGLLFLSVSFVLFSIHSIHLFACSPLRHINAFIFGRDRLAFALLPRSASTCCAGTPFDGFIVAPAIARPTAGAGAGTPTAAMVHEKGISSNSVEEMRSKLWFFLSAVLSGCERYIRGRRLGMELNGGCMCRRR
jgi:hypothetical protein